jgi:hypothetical protein
MCRRLHARYVQRREGLEAIAAKYVAQVPPGSRTVRRAG